MPVYSQIITGEVEYNITNSGYLTDNNYNENSKCIYGKTTEFKNRIVVKFSDNTYGVKYLENPFYCWYYSPKGNLISYTKRANTGFPSEVKKYKPTGEMIMYGIQLSENESYWYKPDGKLIAHWINNNCYNSEGVIIMKRAIEE